MAPEGTQRWEYVFYTFKVDVLYIIRLRPEPVSFCATDSSIVNLRQNNKMFNWFDVCASNASIRNITVHDIATFLTELF